MKLTPEQADEIVQMVELILVAYTQEELREYTFFGKVMNEPTMENLIKCWAYEVDKFNRPTSRLHGQLLGRGKSFVNTCYEILDRYFKEKSHDLR